MEVPHITFFMLMSLCYPLLAKVVAYVVGDEDGKSNGGDGVLYHNNPKAMCFFVSILWIFFGVFSPWLFVLGVISIAILAVIHAESERNKASGDNVTR